MFEYWSIIGDSDPYYDRVRAYLYGRYICSRKEHQQHQACDCSAGDWFGRSVTISGENMVVGATKNDNVNDTFDGTVYGFNLKGETCKGETDFYIK